LITKVATNQFAVSAMIVYERILFLFTYAKIEYVNLVLVFEHIFREKIDDDDDE